MASTGAYAPRGQPGTRLAASGKVTWMRKVPSEGAGPRGRAARFVL